METIQDIIRSHMEDDVKGNILQPAFGVGLVPDLPGPNLQACSGRDESSATPGVQNCVDFFAGGTYPNCLNQNFLSFSAHSAEISEDNCMEFTVRFNEYITTPQNCGVPAQFPTGRTYGFRMNEDYVAGGSEPIARLIFTQVNCPFEIHQSLVDCAFGGLDSRIDANYTIIDETPDEPGCIAGLPF